MDYLKEYDFHYNRTLTIAYYLIKKRLKCYKEKKRFGFDFFYVDVRDTLSDLRYKKYGVQLDKENIEPYKIYESRHWYKTENDRENGEDYDRELLLLVIELGLIPFFRGDSAGMSSFVKALAIEKVLDDIREVFQDYVEFNKLVYQTGKVEYLRLEWFDEKDYRTSKEYEKLQSLINSKKKQIEEPSILEQKPLVKLGQEKRKGASPYIANTMQVVENFHDDERLLLINVLHKIISDDILIEDNREFRIDKMRFMQLVKIIGGFDDLSIFFQNAKQNTSYSKVSKGINYFGPNKRLNIIDSTIEKLRGIDQEVVVNELERMRTQILIKQRKNY